MRVSNEPREDINQSIEGSNPQSPKILVGRAPVRVSFSGGGTDLSSYYEKFEGRVVSAAISRYVDIHLKDRTDGLVRMRSSDYASDLHFKSEKPPSPKPPFDIALTAMKQFSTNGQGLDISIMSEVPPGSGLGSSGTLAVNLVNILASHSGKRLSKHEIAEKAYEIGHDLLGFPIGKQDEYASSFGGMNEFIFSQNGVEVRPISTDPELTRELENHLMLYYLCETREASRILKQQDTRTREGDPVILDALHRSREYAVETRKALEMGDMRDLGRLLNCSWQQKKKYADKVTNPKVDMIYEEAIQSGVYGGKLTGAGGAGHLLLCCPPENQPKVEQRMASLGLKRVPFHLENEGATVREVGFSGSS